MGLNVLGEKSEKNLPEKETGFVAFWDQVEHHCQHLAGGFVPHGVKIQNSAGLLAVT